MSGGQRGHVHPSWWLDEDNFLLPQKHEVNIYQHNQPDNPAGVETLFNSVLEDNPVNVHQFLFDTESAMMRQHVFDSSEEDGTCGDEDESNDESDQRYTDTFCGLRRRFLCNPPMPSLGLRHVNDPYCVKGSNSCRGSAEEAERIAQELVNEEEQAKKKAEKRRLKKKRQKERRRQQKLEKENRSESKIEENVNDKKVLSQKESCTDEEQDHGEVGENAATSPEKGPLVCTKQSGNSRNSHTGKVVAKHSKVKRDREGEATADKSSSHSEDEWDMSSSFVSKAANQIKRKMNIKPKAERKENEKKKAEKKVEHSVDSNTLNAKIYELAVQGNSMANEGRYEDAVGYFTEAIKYDPKEFRLFGNRSYCYERLQQYSRALNDAHIALTLNPSWPKGYFRKARALAGVKKYAEAIEAFQAVLRIDSSCKDAEFELLQVQTKHMMEQGFTQQQCEKTLKLHGSLDQALDALSSAQKPRNSHINSSSSTADGDDEDFIHVKKHSNQQKNKAVAAASAQQPRKLYPIWIGNVTSRVTEDSLRIAFKTVGTIHSIRMLQDRFCAFINFTTKQGSERAIAELQGLELEGTKLVIRYPDNNYKSLGAARAGAAAH